MDVASPPQPVQPSKAVAFDGLALGGVLKAAWRRRWFIAFVTVALTAVDLSAGLLLPRSYRAEALLQVDRRNSRAIDGNMSSLEPELDGGALAGQVDLIRSPALALEVITAQNLLEHPDFARVRAARDGTPAAEGPVGRMLAPLRQGWQQALQWIAGQLPAHLADRLLQHEAGDLQLQAARQDEAAIGAFQKRLQVNYDLRGSSLRIGYVSSEPAVAAAVANAVAAAYVDQQMDRKLDLLRKTSGWLDDRLDILRGKAVESENRLAEFRQRHDLGTPQAPAFTQQQLADLHGQLTTALGAQAQAESRMRAAEEGNAGRRTNSITEIVNSRTITALREQEAMLNRKIAELISGGNIRTAQDVRAEAADLQRRINDEQERILSSLRNEVIAARSRRESVERTIAAVTAQAQERDRFSVEATVLEREAAANRVVFDAAIRRTEEARLVDGLQRPDVGIVVPARAPGSAYSPRLMLIGALGLVTSFILGLALALVLEYRNVTIRSIGQGEAALDIPGIGWLPAVRLRRRERIHDQVVEAPAALYGECVRSAAVSLRALGTGASQVLLITSASPLDGKTSFALSYGRTLAAARQKCLVIDFDLRRPAVGERLGGGNGPGLTDVLLGKAMLTDAIETDAASGLAFLSAGQEVVDPLWALDSQALTSILAEARRRYEVVIVDAPPVLPVADGILVAGRADLVLLVVAWGRTPLRLVTRTVERLRQAGARQLAFVLSAVEVSQLARSDGERQAMAYYGSRSTQRAPALRLVRPNVS